MQTSTLRRALIALTTSLTASWMPWTLHAASPETVPRVAHVDLQRYEGPWFIIGSIPLSIEKGAHNPIETYTVQADGKIKTVFEFRKDRFDGDLEVKNTEATVIENTRNAEWKVKLFWFLKGQYVISHLEPDYSSAIIARDKRDHVWILSRTPKLSDARLSDYRSKIRAMGYDISKFQLFPQDGSMPRS